MSIKALLGYYEQYVLPTTDSFIRLGSPLETPAYQQARAEFHAAHAEFQRRVEEFLRERQQQLNQTCQP